MFKTFEEARDFYSPIPEGRWCTDYFNNDKGQNCAIGLIRPDLNHEEMRAFLADNNGANWRGMNKIFGSTEICVGHYKLLSSKLAVVNNGLDHKYQQPTPKQRVLAFIDDLIAERDADEAVELANQIVSQPIEESCLT